MCTESECAQIVFLLCMVSENKVLLLKIIRFLIQFLLPMKVLILGKSREPGSSVGWISRKAMIWWIRIFRYVLWWMGFGDKWTWWIWMSISLAYFLIIVNGSLKGFPELCVLQQGFSKAYDLMYCGVFFYYAVLSCKFFFFFFPSIYLILLQVFDQYGIGSRKIFSTPNILKELNLKVSNEILFSYSKAKMYHN